MNLEICTFYTQVCFPIRNLEICTFYVHNIVVFTMSTADVDELALQKQRLRDAKPAQMMMFLLQPYSADGTGVTFVRFDMAPKPHLFSCGVDPETKRQGFSVDTEITLDRRVVKKRTMKSSLPSVEDDKREEEEENRGGFFVDILIALPQIGERPWSKLTEKEKWNNKLDQARVTVPNYEHMKALEKASNTKKTKNDSARSALVTQDTSLGGRIHLLFMQLGPMSDDLHILRGRYDKPQE